MIKKRRVILLSVLVLLVMMSWPAMVSSNMPNRVALAIRFSNGSTHTQCIEFNEPQISGLDILMRSGLSVVYQPSSSMAAVCKIQDDGCDYPAEACFCQCKGGSSCKYWSYWHLKDGAWQYSQFGASDYMVGNGDIEGWVWGAGSPSSAPQPPIVDFNSICAPQSNATPLPEDTPLPTDTPTAPPTTTPVPPASISFTVQPEQITSGECATLRWDVEHAQAVFLDGQGVSGYDSRQVCPEQTQSYELRVLSASGETRHTVTVTVLEPLATPIPTLTVSTPTPRQAAVISPAQPSATLGVTPPAEQVVGKRGIRELLGWAAIVGVLLAFLIYVLRRRAPRPNDSA